MRLLFLTNFYPPTGNGGYEQWCQEVADGLHARGHQITVLTSRLGREEQASKEPAWVQRILHMEMEFTSLRNGFEFFTQRQKREQENLNCLRQSIAEFQPEAILIWGMWNLQRSLAVLAEELLPGHVAYYMGDYWPTLPSQYQMYWESPARNWATLLPKSVLGFVAQQILAREQLPTPRFERVIYPTEFMRRELQRKGVAVGDAQIIYGGADTRLYANACSGHNNGGHNNGEHHSLPPAQSTPTCPSKDGQSLNLLYTGRISYDKGVHTAIEAVALLVKEHGLRNLSLTIVGQGITDYMQRLYDLIRSEQIEEYIVFRGWQAKDSLPALYSHADIFLFTSIWQEPFGRVLVEAMASGTAVVGTTAGGAAEILQEGVNGLTFPPGDAGALARQIARLAESPALRKQLASAAKHTAVEKFDIQRMAAEIEEYLSQFAT
jgi:glycogen synthase